MEKRDAKSWNRAQPSSTVLALLVVALLTGSLILLVGTVAAAESQPPVTPDAIVTVCPPPGTGCDYTAIQAAINNANPGDTIRIAGGTYTENLTVTLPLTLEGGYSGPPDWTRDLDLYETIVHAAGETDWGDWDGAEVRDPAIIHDGGTYKMWYIGKGFDYVGRVGYATSPDGLTWTRHVSNPVLEPGAEGEWDSRDLATPFVLQVGPADYRMWYAGLGDDWTWRIGYATSSDGVSWTKHPNNPVLDIGAEIWNNRMVQGPSVLFEGGTYKMWLQTAGDDGSGDWTPYVAYATSPDGVSWTWDAANPLFSRDPPTIGKTAGSGIPTCCPPAAATRCGTAPRARSFAKEHGLCHRDRRGHLDQVQRRRRPGPEPHRGRLGRVGDRRRARHLWPAAPTPSTMPTCTPSAWPPRPTARAGPSRAAIPCSCPARPSSGAARWSALRGPAAARCWMD